MDPKGEPGPPGHPGKILVLDVQVVPGGSRGARFGPFRPFLDAYQRFREIRLLGGRFFWLRPPYGPQRGAQTAGAPKENFGWVCFIAYRGAPKRPVLARNGVRGHVYVGVV